MLRLIALTLNSLSATDLIFFIILGVMLALCVAVYFLIPVINKKQYQEQRENLKKREEAFHANAQAMVEKPVEQKPAEKPAEPKPAEEPADAEPVEQKPAKAAKSTKSTKSTKSAKSTEASNE